MSRVSIINNINTFKRRITEHEGKIRKYPDDNAVAHWKNEIKTFQDQLKKLERDLNVMDSEVFCPSCQRIVSLNGNKCTKCRLVIA